MSLLPVCPAHALEQKPPERRWLIVEHRAAPSRSALPLALHTEGDALALALADAPPSLPPAAATASVAERIEEALANAPSPLSVNAIRKACRMRTQTVTACLADLVRAGRATRTAEGYTIARPS